MSRRVPFALVLALTAPPTAAFSGGGGTGAPQCVHETDRFRPQQPQSADGFGGHLAYDGFRAVIGAPGRDNASGTSAGAAYVFHLLNGAWTQEAEILAPPGPGSVHSNFGNAVAIAGDRILVAARENSASGIEDGAVFVHRRQGTSWVEEATLRASDAEDGVNFGDAVALAGDVALVGAPLRNDLGTWSGAAYVFERIGGAWVETQKLLAPDGDARDALGLVVALSADRAFVGSRDVGFSTLHFGAVYVFARTPGGWELEQKLEASDGANLDRFASSISLFEDRLAVGATGHDGAGDNAGAVYVFDRGPLGWQESARIALPRAQTGDTSAGASRSAATSSSPRPGTSRPGTSAASIPSCAPRRAGCT